MTDAQLNILLGDLLLPYFGTDSVLSQFPGLELLQKYDRTQQGRTEAAIYFVKLFHRRHGWKRVSAEYVPTVPTPEPPAPVGVMRTTEGQYIFQTYQFMALVPQDNERPDLPTESDALDSVAGIINSDKFLADLRARGVGVERITDVRNPFFRDERDRFAADPSFDVVFTHTRLRVDEAPVLVAYDARIQRV